MYPVLLKRINVFWTYNKIDSVPWQWLAFRNDGIYSAADYAKVSSEKLSKSRSLGVGMSWNYFEQEEIVSRKRFFVIKLLQGAMLGLAFMHEHERLHQSLGPSSVVLKYVSGCSFFVF